MSDSGNTVLSREELAAIFATVSARRFLSQAPPLVGAVPQDSFLTRAVAPQNAVVDAFPIAPSSRAFQRLAARLLEPPAPANRQSGGRAGGLSHGRRTRTRRLRDR